MICTLLLFFMHYILVYIALYVFKHCFYIRVGEIHVNNDLLFVCINSSVESDLQYNT